MLLSISCKKSDSTPVPNPADTTENPTDTTQNPVDTLPLDTVPVVIEREFIRGADLSYLPEIRSVGTLYYDSAGNAKDALTIFKENGCNTVRLRLWHTPISGRCTLEEVKTFASEIHSKGMKVLLDFHYSDTWTDPGQQAKPAAWNALPDSVLADSVYRYTRRVLEIIKPEYVQIGNEINGGILWENGRISKPDALVTFLKSGVKAAREVLPSTKVIIHFAGITNSTWFYNMLKTKGLDYDIIGLSYYPVFHGKDLALLESTLTQLSTTHSKKIMLAEMAYPFTLSWADYTHNLVGETGQLVSGYPATPQGQRDFLVRLRKMLTDNPSGIGFCYWAPDFVAYRGPTATNGSSMENQALFDFAHKVQPGMQVFRK